MEAKDYLAIIRRWAWLLGLGFVLGAMIGVLVSAFQSPVYQASTRILVMRAPQEKTTDYTYLSDQQLVQTYIQLLTTRPVLDGASAKLGFIIDPKQVNVQQIRDTQAIQLTVEDGNAQRASDIANVLIQVLIDQNENIQSGRYALTEQSIQAQIKQIQDQITQMGSAIDNVSAETVQQQQKQVETQIATLSSEVAQLQSDIQQLSSSTAPDQQALLAEKQDRLKQIQPILALYQQVYTDLVVMGKPVSSGDGTTQLSQMQSTLQLYQQIYINLLNNLEDIRLARLQNTPNVVQIESAIVPSLPIRPRPVLNTALGAIVGLLLAGAIAYLIDYLDDTIRTPEDIERILKLPVVGYIGDMRNSQGLADEIHVVRQPRSPIAEAFRSLRTNLEFTNVDSSLTKILITSPGPSEGKTTVSTNLAAIIAQGGKRVLLIDADLRRPRIHSIFGVNNHIGLTTLFRGQTSLKSVMRQVDGAPGFYIITSGKLPPNPAELLASARMDQILEEASREADVIILDSPPSLVADFQVLATKVDGVVLVIQPGFTHADITVATLERLQRVNAKTLGVVLNRIPNDSHYYGGYYRYHQPYKYGSDYYLPEDNANPQLLAENQPVKLLPASRMPESNVEFDEAKERTFISVQPQQVYIPREDVPASRDVITKPRKRNDALQPFSLKTERQSKSPREAGFHIWYYGQDEVREEDED
jgi:polysaccharide biosynthesis transport protein